MEKNTRKEIVELMKKSSLISKTHGLDRLVLSRNITMRVIWIACLLISTGVCSYLISQSILQYFDYEVDSRIREVHLEEIPFPEVLICNVNPLVTPTANKFIQDYFLENFNIIISKYSDLFNSILEGFIPPDELDYILYTTYNPQFNISLKKSFGYWNYHIECNFLGLNCQTEWYYDPSYGNCLRVNSIKNVYQPNSGLSIVMFTGVPDEAETYLYESETKGLTIAVGENEILPLIINGVNIKTGFLADIVISKKLTENLPVPYSNCLDSNSIDTVLSREMKRIGLKYSRKNCLFLCEQQQNIDKIGCNDMRRPRLFNAPLCDSKVSYQSIGNTAINMSLCIDMCPIECSLVTYDLSVSYLEYPSYNTFYQFQDKLNLSSLFGTKNVTYKMFQESVAGARIYFKDIKYTEITESPSMTIDNLLAFIGGTMGLFIGFSVMIVVEIVELIVEMISIILKNNYRSNFLFCRSQKK